MRSWAFACCIPFISAALRAAPQQPPPAFFGGSCNNSSAYWNDQSGQVAEVLGQPGEELPLHPNYPPKCSGESKSCDGNAYLIAGDRVVIGARCGAWTDVQFSSLRSKSWGWVESARLKELGSAEQVSLDHHAPVAAAPPGVCEAARDRLNQTLLHARGAALFTLVPLNFQSEEKLPPAFMQRIDDQQDMEDFYSTDIANVLIRGVRAKVVVHSPGGSCVPTKFDIWTHDFKKQLYADPNDDPHVREELENYGTDTYLVTTNNQSNEIVLYGFTRGLEPAQFCALRLVPRKPQQVVEAADPELCNAVRDGEVEQVPGGEGESFEIAAEALGLDRQWHYSLGPKARVDIYNDGHPMSVAIATGTASSGAGCGSEFRTSWPVVLGKDDMPDRSLKKIEAADEEAHLIRYHGTIYVETNSAEGSSSYNHDVWKVSHDGVAKVCSYLPVRYDIQ